MSQAIQPFKRLIIHIATLKCTGPYENLQSTWDILNQQKKKKFTVIQMTENNFRNYAHVAQSIQYHAVPYSAKTILYRDVSVPLVIVSKLQEYPRDQKPVHLLMIPKLKLIP